MRATPKYWMVALVLVAAVLMVLPGEVLGVTADGTGATVSENGTTAVSPEDEVSKLGKLWDSTGIHGFFSEGVVKTEESGGISLTSGVKKLIMIFVGLLLIYLGIAKKFEPLLLIPIGFGGILANIPYAGIAEISEGGFLALIFDVGITSGVFPLLIFMGVGAMTDFGPLLANPKTALLGAAAQLGRSSNRRSCGF
jgi:hypothetical protein